MTLDNVCISPVKQYFGNNTESNNQSGPDSFSHISTVGATSQAVTSYDEQKDNINAPSCSKKLCFDDPVNQNYMDIESSSTTDTASETEQKVLQFIKTSSKDASEEIVRSRSGFRGKLRLVNLPKKRY